ncbi:MAG: divalent-cation tolerance protein CutA [Ramlibacter sp.]
MEARADLEIVAVTTTVGSVAEAQALARAILERRLAACVQVEPGLQSFYRWEGRTCEDPEVRLSIKTTPAALSALQALFAERHPYQLPQFAATVMQASPAYAQWVRDETAPTSESAASPAPPR